MDEIEIARQRGFMDYIFEKLEVFNEAYAVSIAALEKYIAVSVD